MSADDTTPQASNNPSSPDSAEVLVENYLDHLYAPLVGRMPYSHRHRLREEVKDHLLSLVQHKHEESQSEVEAIAAALDQFGHPHYLAEKYLREWRRERSKDGTPLSLRDSFKFALGCFAGMTLLAWAVMLPFFVFGMGFYLFMGIRPDLVIVFLLPLLTGGLMGYYRKGRLFLATFYVLALLLLPHAVAYLYAPAFGYENYGFSSIYEFFVFCFGMYWLPFCFMGIAFGRLLYRSLIWVKRGRPQYRQLGLT